MELIPGTDVDPWEPGSLGWLLPWAETGEGDLMTPDQALETFLTWVEARGIEPWPHQEDALVDLAAGDHVVLGTPTGSGKSLVAMGLCFIAMATGRRAYYTAPIKALVSEKFFAMVDVMGKDNVGMLTGDASINADAPIVCCTAEILANIALAEGEDARANCVVMDEFHYYGEPDRGWAWQVPLLVLKRAQFLLMSATLGDMTSIATALQERTGRTVDMVLDAPRPVPLSFQYATTFLEATVELALRAGDEPLYVVHFSQDEAFGSAQKLSNFGIATKEQREGIKKVMRGTRFTTPFGRALQRLLLAGVGVHHAGMLPRYRLLVEKLAQKGLLSVICGTDTLGVGINVPIHTVVFTSLAKFDGVKQRRLRAREFHQIAGRAGRSGFDTEGVVIAEAPDHEIANLKAVEKAGGDPKKLRKIKKKQPPEGFVSWSEKTFERLVEAQPETLVPRMKMTHGMVLNVVGRGGDARANIQQLIDESAQTPEEKAALAQRADEIFATLVDTGVVVVGEDENGARDFRLTVELPEDFALDQPLSPFLLSALSLFSPDEPNYALDVISLVEATLEDPRQVLRAQQRKERDRAMAQMKADGIDYEERLERLREVTYPRPLEDELAAAFELYCKEVPWARDFELMPKSVLRDMVESAADFKTYVNTYGIARSEGTLLRYLSDAYRVLEKTVPPAARDEQLEQIVDWLGLLVRTTDSSLVDEWARAGELPQEDVGGFGTEDAVVRDRRGMELMVRNALFTRVKLIAQDKADALGALDENWGFGARQWGQALDAFYDAHDDARIDADARSKQYLVLDASREEADHAWHVHQIVLDTEGDCDFCIDADVDLDASQEEGEVVFRNYRVGFADELD